MASDNGYPRCKALVCNVQPGEHWVYGVSATVSSRSFDSGIVKGRSRPDAKMWELRREEAL